MQWSNRISVTGKVILNYPVSEILGFIQDLTNISKYEPKLLKIKIKPVNATTGTYYAQGTFFGMPWNGKFSYQITQDGFISQMIKGPLKKMRGSFIVKHHSESSSLIIHQEMYDLPMWTKVLNIFLRWNLHRSMVKELSSIREIIQIKMGVKDHKEKIGVKSSLR